MKKLLTGVVVLVFSVAVFSCGGGQTRSGGDAAGSGSNMRGQATGYGTVFDNDVALARDRAIDDAMNKLVKDKLGTMVSGSALVQDFQLIESIVEAKSTGMVRNWKIINEKTDGGTHIVTIEGEVYPAAVNETIKATLQNYGRPKFMVLMTETFEGRRNTPGMTVTELTMMQIMGNAGFEFVDSQMTQQLVQRENARMANAMMGNISEDVQNLLLNDVGAEVIIIGQTSTSDQTAAATQYARNMQSKQAIVNLKAIDVYTGRVLATVSSNAPGMHIDANTASKMAIQRCLESIKVLGKNDDDGNFQSGDFMNQITRKFLEAATRRMIMINVVGLDYANLTKFRNLLEQRIRGVNKVYPRGQAGNTAKIEIEFAGKTNDFADELNAKAGNFGFSVEIKEVYPNRIMMTATPR